jgi:hypothetical protein
MGEHGAPADVHQWMKDHVLISIPLVGFPPGFQLRPGERVMVMVEDSGLAARPLVEVAYVSERPEDLAQRGQVDINGQRHTLQSATVTVKSDPTKPPGAVVFAVDSGSAQGPKQIIAMRPQ